MLIGITGTDGSGKGEVVAHLVEKGFVHCSARAIFEEEMDRQGLEHNRANMRIVANELRKKHGNDFLITHYLEKIDNEGIGDAVVESLRAIAEVHTLKDEGGVLLAVDANQKLRYERIQKRASSSDQVTFEEFQRHEELEMDDPDPHGMQKKAVIEAADFTVTNNGTLDELHAQIDNVLKETTV